MRREDTPHEFLPNCTRNLYLGRSMMCKLFDLYCGGDGDCRRCSLPIVATNRDVLPKEVKK